MALQIEVLQEARMGDISTEWDHYNNDSEEWTQDQSFSYYISTM